MGVAEGVDFAVPRADGRMCVCVVLVFILMRVCT